MFGTEWARTARPPSALTISTTLINHQTIVDHGDLQPKNTIVDKRQDLEMAQAVLKLSLIDWEISGWYPEHWESCNVMIAGRYCSDWLEMAQAVLTNYSRQVSFDANQSPNGFLLNWFSSSWSSNVSSWKEQPIDIQANRDWPARPKYMYAA